MRALAALLLLASPALAQGEDPDFDGVYKQTANAECALVGVDGGSVEIRDGIFYGVEVECRMTNPVDVLRMEAQLYDMVCSGEGTSFTERAMVMRAAEGDAIYLIWNGFAFRYEACEAPGE